MKLAHAVEVEFQLVGEFIGYNSPVTTGHVLTLEHFTFFEGIGRHIDQKGKLNVSIGNLQGESEVIVMQIGLFDEERLDSEHFKERRGVTIEGVDVVFHCITVWLLVFFEIGEARPNFGELGKAIVETDETAVNLTG